MREEGEEENEKISRRIHRLPHKMHKFQLLIVEDGEVEGEGEEDEEMIC